MCSNLLSTRSSHKSDQGRCEEERKKRRSLKGVIERHSLFASSLPALEAVPLFTPCPVGCLFIISLSPSLFVACGLLRFFMYLFPSARC